MDATGKMIAGGLALLTALRGGSSKSAQAAKPPDSTETLMARGFPYRVVQELKAKAADLSADRPSRAAPQEWVTDASVNWNDLFRLGDRRADGTSAIALSIQRSINSFALQCPANLVWLSVSQRGMELPLAENGILNPHTLLAMKTILGAMGAGVESIRNSPAGWLEIRDQFASIATNNRRCRRG